MKLANTLAYLDDVDSLDSLVESAEKEAQNLAKMNERELNDFIKSVESEIENDD